MEKTNECLESDDFEDEYDDGKENMATILTITPLRCIFRVLCESKEV